MNAHPEYTFSFIGGKTLAARISQILLVVGFLLGLFFASQVERDLTTHTFIDLLVRISGLLSLVFLFQAFIVIPIFGKFKLLGKLKLNGYSISIIAKNGMVKSSYLTNEITNFKIIYNECERDMRGGWARDGVGNFIEFEDKTGKKNKFELLIDDDRKLHFILTSWKNNGIKFELIYGKKNKRRFSPMQ